MATAADIHGTVFKNGTATLLARLVGNGGAHLTPTDIGAIACSVYLLDDSDPDARTPVTGHSDVPLNAADVLLNSLQTDALWTTDSIGYNFRHTINVSSHQAFATAGRRYLVEYRLTPVAGQVIVVRFRMNVI